MMNISVSLPQIGWTFAGLVAILVAFFLFYIIGSATLHFMDEDEDLPAILKALIGIIVLGISFLICMGAYNLGGWLHTWVSG